MDSVTRELHRTSTNVNLLENTLRPFCRLHSDIIIEISEYLDPRACNNRYEPLLCAAQICRIWRDTLTSHPPLWSFISGSRPCLIPRLLNRSKHIQLNVHILSHRFQEVIGYIHPHADRLSSVHFDLGSYDDNHNDVPEALRSLGAAPKLRRLNIECQWYPGLLPNFSGHTLRSVESIQSLRHLQLFRFPITPDFTQLTNLTVVGLDAGCTTRDIVLHLISRNPRLEVLRLWGPHSNQDLSGDSGHPPRSITLPHLKVLWLGVAPLAYFEALYPPRCARIFAGFPLRICPNYVPRGDYNGSFPIPASFSNLRDLRKLRLVDQEKIYIKVEGEEGSIAYCTPNGNPFIDEVFSGVPWKEVTDAIYEISPLFWHRSFPEPTSSPLMVSRIICRLVRLQKLELSCCSAKHLDSFLLVLHSTNVCKDLKDLVLSHCVEIHRQIRSLATLAEGRKAAGMGLHVVRIIHPNIERLKGTFKLEDSTRLERAIGALEYVEAELGWSGQSSLRFDPEAGLDQPHIFF